MSGWSDPEQGYTFTTGFVSTFSLGGEKFPGGCFIELLIQPFAKPPLLPWQTIGIRVNGFAVGFCKLASRTRICVQVPSKISCGGISTIMFEHHDARSPASLGVAADNRVLAFSFFELVIFSIQRESPIKVYERPFTHVRVKSELTEHMFDEVKEHGVDVRELMGRFESIGDNCEFGLFQRVMGAEPLGLLRFSTVHRMPLVEGIEFCFDGLGQEDNMIPKAEDDGNEWMMYETRYKLRYHTHVRPSQMSEQDVRLRETKKLGFLRRKFLEDLQGGEKIFVYKNATDQLSAEEVLPIYRALNMHSSNTLLWVIPASYGYSPGTVETIMPGFLRGHIDRLANVHTPLRHSQKGWLEICLAAKAMIGDRWQR